MKRNKRSKRLWLLILAFGVLAFSGWQRTAASLAGWFWLEQAGASPGPLYMAMSGVLWGLVGLLAAAWLLQYWRAFRWVGLAAALFLFLTYWLDRLLFSRADGLGANLGFVVVVSLLGLAYTAFVLRPWQKRT